MYITAYLCVEDGLHPAATLSATVGLKAVRRHGATELIEVDEQEAPGVLQLPAHHVTDDKGLPDNFHFFHALHRLTDQQNVSEEETVHIHLSETEGEAVRQTIASLVVNGSC